MFTTNIHSSCKNQEASANDQDVKASEEFNILHSIIPTDLKDECPAAIGREYINSDGQRCRDLSNDESCYGGSSVGDVPSSDPEIIWPKMQTEAFSSSSTVGVSADAGIDFTSKSKKKKYDIFCFDNGLGKVVCLDRRVTVEAAEGLQKAQEVAKCMNDATKLLKERTSEAGGSALELLTNALSKTLYLERLLQMKKTTSVNDKCMIDNTEDLLSSATTIQELLYHRKAGNENFKLGKYTEAVENYTADLSSNIKSCPLQQYVLATVLLHINLQAKLLMSL
ncbi:hypothetical protein RYX36_002745 [Vicia faba]